ncbi:MAG: hypothetical protein A2X25_02105 [Chloroflexi bacterium GWB2_49_20]|nr:MAG: hypothetical protein A2X25_02105 [Chloroflexi bacterium GWB2_49_20]OGN78239.1 MAG: hypothetical protein A2X26_14710 [Chloroflexi bacterium GWC2_49_37]
MSDSMRGQIGKVWLIAHRELRDQFRDWRIIVPMIVLTIFFPFLMTFTAKQALDFVASYGGGTIIPERLVPFLLMVVGFFPITVSLVIALESFVGEKERGTIEPLLSSPLKDWHIYLGKLFASASVPLITAYLGISVFLIYLKIDNIAIPDINLLTQTIFLTTVQALLMVSGAIVISTQATSVRAANLLSSFIVIPIAILIQGESVLMFWGNNQILWLAIIGVSILAVLMIRVGIAHFQREALLGREIDILNFKWIIRTFWNSFSGNYKNIFNWYRYEIPKTLKKMRITIVLIILMGIIGAVFSYYYVLSYDTALAFNPETVSGELRQVFGTEIGSFGDATISVQYIFGNNVRAIGVILLLGLVSFGVLGAIAYIVNMGLIGAVLAFVSIFGYSQAQIVLSGILPHGVFEIPAIILSSAAVLHIGITLITPLSQRSLGEVLIESLADWAKIAIGITVPLLVIAAMIETWVTPILLLSVIK